MLLRRVEMDKNNIPTVIVKDGLIFFLLSYNISMDTFIRLYYFTSDNMNSVLFPLYTVKSSLLVPGKCTKELLKIGFTMPNKILSKELKLMEENHSRIPKIARQVSSDLRKIITAIDNGQPYKHIYRQDYIPLIHNTPLVTYYFDGDKIWQHTCYPTYNEAGYTELCEHIKNLQDKYKNE